MRQIKEGFGHGISLSLSLSLSLGDLRQETGGRATLLGTPTVMSRRALEMEPLPHYRGSVSETWRKDCYTEDSDSHVEEGFENGATSSL